MSTSTPPHSPDSSSPGMFLEKSEVCAEARRTVSTSALRLAVSISSIGKDEIVSDPRLHNPVHCIAAHATAVTLAIASHNIVRCDIRSKTSKTQSSL